MKSLQQLPRRSEILKNGSKDLEDSESPKKEGADGIERIRNARIRVRWRTLKATQHPSKLHKTTIIGRCCYTGNRATIFYKQKAP